VVVSGWCTIGGVALEKFMFALLLVVEMLHHYHTDSVKRIQTCFYFEFLHKQSTHNRFATNNPHTTVLSAAEKSRILEQNCRRKQWR
jgi:hypothetical protein